MSLHDHHLVIKSRKSALLTWRRRRRRADVNAQRLLHPFCVSRTPRAMDLPETPRHGLLDDVLHPLFFLLGFFTLTPSPVREPAQTPCVHRRLPPIPVCAHVLKRDNVAFAQRAAACRHTSAEESERLRIGLEAARATYWNMARKVPPIGGRRWSKGSLPSRSTRVHRIVRGHMWLAAAMGALAESYRSAQGLKYSTESRTNFLTVLRTRPLPTTRIRDRCAGRGIHRCQASSAAIKIQEHRVAPYLQPNSSRIAYFLSPRTLIALKRKPEAR
jgi:hypothetical protein